MLFDSKWPKQLWSQAVSCARCIRNRSITRKTEQTPCKLWFPRKVWCYSFPFLCLKYLATYSTWKAKETGQRATEWVFVDYSCTMSDSEFYALFPDHIDTLLSLKMNTTRWNLGTNGKSKLTISRTWQFFLWEHQLESESKLKFTMDGLEIGNPLLKQTLPLAMKLIKRLWNAQTTQTGQKELIEEVEPLEYFEGEKSVRVAGNTKVKPLQKWVFSIKLKSNWSTADDKACLVRVTKKIRDELQRDIFSCYQVWDDIIAALLMPIKEALNTWILILQISIPMTNDSSFVFILELTRTPSDGLCCLAFASLLWTMSFVLRLIEENI